MKVISVDRDLAARQRLGDAVEAARVRAGYSDIDDWAKRVGRSSRTLYGLERGEHQGKKTYTAVADALGWSTEKLYGILDGYVEATALTDVSDDELAAEVLRRMKSGDGDVRRDAAPMTESLRAVASEGDESDADEVDEIARKQREKQLGDKG